MLSLLRNPWVIFTVLIFFSPQVLAQEAPEDTSKSGLFFDPDNGALDFSAFLNTAKGFLPVGGLITEPAVGYGGMLGLLFLHDSLENRAQKVAESNPNGTLKHLPPPSMTSVMGFLTENGTWGGGVYHLGVFKEDRIRYTGGLFYNNMELEYYGPGGDFRLPMDSVSYTLEGFFIVQQLLSRVADSNLFLGASYKFMSLDTRFDFNLDFEVPEWFPPLERNIKSGGASIIAEYDSRNTVFTPDTGMDFITQMTFFEEALGSDRHFFKAYANLRGWVPLQRSFVLGMRVDANFSDGDTPFFMLPFVDMRGISLSRYQGQYTLATEAELRWDVNRRWSLLGFVGSGWAASDQMSDYVLKDGHMAGGTGFRYLISRVFGIRTGMDFAWSEDDFALYFTTGTAWGQK